MLNTIKISKFKKLRDCEIDLGRITVLVGANNSGKSCFLQGVHFGAALSQSQKIANSQQFTPERLRYCPTDNFLNLKHGDNLTETSGIDFSYSRVVNEVLESSSIQMLRGRNGVVKAVPGPDTALYREMSDPKSFFSIYAPGLAGITIREEYRSDLVVNNGIARGDANLYLRNVLLRINQDPQKKQKFSGLLNQIFPGYVEKTSFNQTNDLWIDSIITPPGGAEKPLDSSGTGLLQTIQLLAYVTNYSPKLLLLDEPDSHLHPNNQRLLAKALHLISQEGVTQVILATHSRHLLDAFSDYDDVKLFFMKDGVATAQTNWADISILMDLGALDRGEHFLNGAYRHVFYTEDTDTKLIKILLEANGFSLNETLLLSYKSSTKIESAALLSEFIKRIRPGVPVIIHRDRDFMIDDECRRLMDRYNNIEGADVFITAFSDIESYFIQPTHVAECLGVSLHDATTIISAVLDSNSNELILKFRDKRENIKKDLYKNDPDNCPDTQNLLPNTGVELQSALGKILKKRISAYLQNNGMNPASLDRVTTALADTNLSRYVRQNG